MQIASNWLSFLSTPIPFALFDCIHLFRNSDHWLFPFNPEIQSLRFCPVFSLSVSALHSMTTLPEDERAVLELRMRVEEDDDDEEKESYVKLSEGLEKGQEEEEEDEETANASSPFWFWVKLSLLFALLAALAVVGYIWIGPLIMNKELIPIIQWELRTFTHPVCGLLVFASVAVFPTILLPSTPSMWIAGMTFGYGYGFLLIISAAAVGVSLPYFIGHLFCHKIQGWLDRYPVQAAVLRAAGEGNWIHQFRLVTLIRISPFPYILYNYCAVATRVKYGPYITGSLVGMVPEVFVAIYTGILVRTLAEASSAEKQGLSVTQITLNILGFLATLATTILITKYAKRQLETMKKEEEALLQ